MAGRTGTFVFTDIWPDISSEHSSHVLLKRLKSLSFAVVVKMFCI